MRGSGRSRLWILVSHRFVYTRYASADLRLAAILLNSESNPKCRECGSVDIDTTYKRVFGCLVCGSCKNAHPEKYSLLTKTECKEVGGCFSIPES